MKQTFQQLLRLNGCYEQIGVPDTGVGIAGRIHRLRRVRGGSSRAGSAGGDISPRAANWTPWCVFGSRQGSSAAYDLGCFHGHSTRRTLRWLALALAGVSFVLGRFVLRVVSFQKPGVERVLAGGITRQHPGPRTIERILRVQGAQG